jgi:hypothetical protein
LAIAQSVKSKEAHMKLITEDTVNKRVQKTEYEFQPSGDGVSIMLTQDGSQISSWVCPKDVRLIIKLLKELLKEGVK